MPTLVTDPHSGSFYTTSAETEFVTCLGIVKPAAPFPPTTPIEMTFSKPVSNFVINAYNFVEQPNEFLPPGCSYAMRPSSATMTVFFSDGSSTVIPAGWADPYSFWSYGPPPGTPEDPKHQNKIVRVRFEPGAGEHLTVMMTYVRWFEHPPCPTGDSLLDEAAVRDLLKVSWANSNADDPIKLNRRERGGFILEHSDGSLFHKTDFDPPDTPCRAPLVPDFAVGDSLVAMVHVHPFRDQDTTTGVCSQAVPGIEKFYDAKTWGGPSLADILRAASDGIVSIVMDKDNIYEIPLGTDTTNALMKIKRYPRVDPQTGYVRP